MRYRRLGRSGLKVSEVALGGWFNEGVKNDEWMLNQLLGEALERGVNLIDLADIYGSGETEVLYGRLLKNYPRHQLVLSSKCFWPMSEGVNDCGLSRKHLMESVHGSLKRLKTDYLDIFLCHAEDPETPLEETVRAIADLIRQGKILYWGICGWQAQRVSDVINMCAELNAPQPINHQLVYNLLERHPERVHLKHSAELGLGVTAWSPLAGGILARNGRRRNASDKSMRSLELMSSLWRVDELRNHHADKVLAIFERLAQEASMTRAQLAISWVLRRQEIASVILGVSSIEQLQDNLAVLELNVPTEILNQLDQLFTF